MPMEWVVLINVMFSNSLRVLLVPLPLIAMADFSSRLTESLFLDT